MELLDFIGQAVSPFHTVKTAIAYLEAHGFQKLEMREAWKVKEAGNYYVSVYDSSLAVFRLGKKPGMLRIMAAHTDFPCFKIKPESEIWSNAYGKLNVEPYGGLIYHTWMDRPLSIAGKVALRGDSPFSPRTCLVDFKRPVLTIPNLAIHMNREVNKGAVFNEQKDLLPLATMKNWVNTEKDWLLEEIAKEAGAAVEEILDFELYIYQAEEGCTVGFGNPFLSSPRLDNLTSVAACLNSIVHTKPESGVAAAILFDNEEIGSRTKQGADSAVFPLLLEKLYLALGLDREQYLNQIADGFLLSVDVAHGLHPNSPEKADLTNQPVLNGGVVLKIAASQSYANDCEAVAVVKELCRNRGIPCQLYVNRSDMRGGSTLGSLLSSWLPMRTMDIGVPLLAMHSARELMGVKDQAYLEQLLEAFLIL